MKVKFTMKAYTFYFVPVLVYINYISVRYYFSAYLLSCCNPSLATLHSSRRGGHPSRGRRVRQLLHDRSNFSVTTAKPAANRHLPREGWIPCPLLFSFSVDRVVWQTRRIKLFTRRLEILEVLISGSPRNNFSYDVPFYVTHPREFTSTWWQSVRHSRRTPDYWTN